jgi:hypothetical protein
MKIEGEITQMNTILELDMAQLLSYSADCDLHVIG